MVGLQYASGLCGFKTAEEPVAAFAVTARELQRFQQGRTKIILITIQLQGSK